MTISISRYVYIYYTYIIYYVSYKMRILRIYGLLYIIHIYETPLYSWYLSPLIAAMQINKFSTIPQFANFAKPLEREKFGTISLLRDHTHIYIYMYFESSYTKYSYEGESHLIFAISQGLLLSTISCISLKYCHSYI